MNSFKTLAAAATIVPAICLAAPEAISTPIAGSSAAFVVSIEFAPNGKVFVPVYRHAIDHLAIKAAETCPTGYDKIAETVRGGGETAILGWKISCITPSTPSTTPPSESR